MANKADENGSNHKQVTTEDVERLLHLGELLRSVLSTEEIDRLQQEIKTNSNGSISEEPEKQKKK
ncbi:MAG: hypothetical protein OEV06_10495 [Anaerolineae bacterium]|nr:hypothetical protein [Anaerolineae bacterium]